MRTLQRLAEEFGKNAALAASMQVKAPGVINDGPISDNWRLGYQEGMAAAASICLIEDAGIIHPEPERIGGEPTSGPWFAFVGGNFVKIGNKNYPGLVKKMRYLANAGCVAELNDDFNSGERDGEKRYTPARDQARVLANANVLACSHDMMKALEEIASGRSKDPMSDAANVLLLLRSGERVRQSGSWEE